MKNTKKPRVKYNFVLNVPSSDFTLQDLETLNPDVQYITLYMRVKKMLKDKKLKLNGVKRGEKTRGRSLKVFSTAA